MTDITIHWSGPTSCLAGDTYNIEADLTTPGTYDSVSTGIAATAPYASPQTTLAAVLSADRSDLSVELADATEFADDDIVSLVTENVRLDGKSGATFITSERGYGSNVARAHPIGEVVTLMHESRVETIEFNDRRIIRFRISHVDGEGNISVASEFIAWNLPKPRGTRMATLYGIVVDTQGNAISGITVTIQVGDVDNYISPTGEMIAMTQIQTTTDNDGFWSVNVPRDSYHNALSPDGGDPITVKINAGQSTEYSREIPAIPDRPLVNVLDIT